MALILIFSLSLQAPFPPLGDQSGVAGEKKAASAQLAERGVRMPPKTLKVMCSGAGNGERGFCLGKAERLCKVKNPKQRIRAAESSGTLSLLLTAST